MQQIESIPKSDLAEIIARQAEIVSAAVRAEAQKLGVGYDKKHMPPGVALDMLQLEADSHKRRKGDE